MIGVVVEERSAPCDHQARRRIAATKDAEGIHDSNRIFALLDAAAREGHAPAGRQVEARPQPGVRCLDCRGETVDIDAVADQARVAAVLAQKPIPLLYAYT